MGWKAQPKTYVLRFEDPKYEGLEVKTRSLPLGDFLSYDDMSATEGFEWFAEKVLVSWNITDDNDEPVPCTRDGLFAQDLELVRDLIEAWKDAVIGVAAPLEKPSPAGEMFPVASIPMETLSDARAS